MPETVPPEVPSEQPTASVILVPLLRWGERGNVVVAAGSVLLDLAEVR